MVAPTGAAVGQSNGWTEPRPDGAVGRWSRGRTEPRTDEAACRRSRGQTDPQTDRAAGGRSQPWADWAMRGRICGWTGWGQTKPRAEGAAGEPDRGRRAAGGWTTGVRMVPQTKPRAREPWTIFTCYLIGTRSLRFYGAGEDSGELCDFPFLIQHRKVLFFRTTSRV